MKQTFLRLTLLASLILFVGQGCVSLDSGRDEFQTEGPGGMFVSDDSGESWSPISNYLKAEGAVNISAASVYRLENDPQDANTMYWATRGQGYFYSYDNGKSWLRPLVNLNTGFVYAIAVHPEDKCTLFASTGKSVYRTNDCGRSFAEVYRENTSDIVHAIGINPFPPYQVYLGKQLGDFLVSNDAGISWEKLLTFVNKKVVDLHTDPHVEGRMYLTTQEHGVFRTENFGKQWKWLNDGLEQFSKGLEHRRFLVYPGRKDLLFYVSTFGLHISQDGGDTWRAPELIHPAGSAKIYGFAVNPQNEKEIYYTATINDRSTLYKSIDGGKNWITKKLPSGQIPSALRVHPEKGNLLFLGFTIPPEQ